MKRWWLIGLWFGTICGVGLACTVGLCIPTYTQSVVPNNAEPEPAVPAKDEVVFVQRADNLSEKLLALGDKKANVRTVSFQRIPSDDDVVALGSLPNLRGVTLSLSQGMDEAIAVLTRLPDIRELDLICHGATDAGVRLLNYFPKLEKLTLRGNAYTDAGLASVGDLKRLRELHLSSSLITDDGLVFLGKLTELRTLSLYCGESVTDAGLSQLQYLYNLENLVISCPLMTAEGLSYLTHLKLLKRLNLSMHQGLTGSGIAPIKYLRQLVELKINDQNREKFLDDTGMASIGQLVNLRKLELLNVHNITDAGLSQLQYLYQLEDLTIRGNAITGEGLATLGRLQSLRRLVLASQGLTVPGFSHIRNLQRVTELHIDGTVTNEMLQFLENNTTLESLGIRSAVESGGGGFRLGETIDNTGMEPLKTLRQLKSLDIYYTNVTALGRYRLQEALPDCQIKSRR